MDWTMGSVGGFFLDYYLMRRIAEGGLATLLPRCFGAIAAKQPIYG
jgi:hypothetical protein